MTDWNVMAEVNSQITKEEIMGKPLLKYIEPQLKRGVEHLLRQALRGVETSKSHRVTDASRKCRSDLPDKSYRSIAVSDSTNLQ